MTLAAGSVQARESTQYYCDIIVRQARRTLFYTGAAPAVPHVLLAPSEHDSMVCLNLVIACALANFVRKSKANSKEAVAHLSGEAKSHGMALPFAQSARHILLWNHNRIDRPSSCFVS